MSRPYILKRGVSSVLDLKNGGLAYGFGVGNVYQVVQASNTSVYNYVQENFAGQYADGSQAVHTSITSALAATVAERNDYVIVWPDDTDYDEGATLTMNKACVHLICPAGLGMERGCARGATIDPSSAATAITITGRGVEVAGFWIRGYAEQLVVSAGGTGCWVHHNDIAIASTSSSGTAGAGVTIGAAGVRVENNFIFTNAGTSATVTHGILASAGTTRTIVRNNDIMVSNGCTMTVGIQTGGNDVMCLVDGNILGECAAGGSTGAGTLTAGINVGTASFATNNRIGLATQNNAITGGTADQSFVSNYEASSGGTLAI